MLDTIYVETLKNNLRVVSVPMDTASVTALVLFGAGSRYEKKNEGGLSHFLEHMMFKGTKSRPTALEIAQEIDSIGGQFNAYTAKDHTGYWIKSAAEHAPKLITILSDMTLHSLLKQEEIDREKGVIIEEMNMYEDTPMRKVGEIYERLLYGDTPLGRDIIGTKETVLSFTHDDFDRYMDRLYAPGNSVVIVAGGVGKKGMLTKYVEDAFGDWKDRETPHYKKQTENQKTPALKIVRKKTEQTHIVVGARAFGLSDKRRYALGLLSIILGGGMSSRLFHQVRERRGLAYYVRSMSERYQDVGTFVTQAGIDHRKVEETVSVILDEYKKLRKQKAEIRKSELQKAKAFIKGHMILGLEDSRGVAELFGNSLLLEGKIRPFSEILNRIESVTADEIADVAEDIFVPEKLNMAAIGPFPDGIDERLARLIQL